MEGKEPRVSIAAALIETTLGDFVVDLYDDAARPFLQLCLSKSLIYRPFISVASGFVAQVIFTAVEQNAVIDEAMEHGIGTVGIVGNVLYITLANIEMKGNAIGKITEGVEIISKMNETLVDDNNRPMEDIVIKNIHILSSTSSFETLIERPIPTKQQIQSLRILFKDDKISSADQILIDKAKASALTLEIIGDLPEATMQPPENILFVCKLNPITKEDDLKIIFSRFGAISSCRIIKDEDGRSLGYAFIEFCDKSGCEEAYFKMDGVIIDDRSIRVDFSQSVSRFKSYVQSRNDGIALKKRKQTDSYELV